MPDGQGGNTIIQTLSKIGWGYVWFALLALWGGTVNYISRVKRSHKSFSFVELIGEWTISAFAGVITALICQEMGLSLLITSALAGISGHMGGRAIYISELFLASRFGIPTNIHGQDDEPKDKD